ncbi:MAG: response regulator [Elusimicrobiota bacterium]
MNENKENKNNLEKNPAGTPDEKILVCDDDDKLRRTIQMLLERKGYNIVTVDCGKKLLEKIDDDYYELIVLDMRMPDMDGIRVLEYLKKKQIGKMKSNVIIITGHASEDIPIKALNLGVTDYILKPFELPEFLLSVERNMKLVRVMKEKELFFKKMVEKSAGLKLTQSEMEKLKSILESESKA